GAERFLRTCSACHGEKGDGRSLASATLKTHPRDFTTEEARTNLSREYMIAIVRDGRPHTAMVGRTERLAQREIEDVVDFIRAAFMPPEPGSALARGRERYRGSCAACHGDRGQGVPARAGGPAVPPLAAARARAGLTAKEMLEAILRDPHAPGFSLPAPRPDAPEAQSVVEYVRSAFIEAAALRRGADPKGR
ncbi:MAG: c-type cytochrome, partial [Lysobacter sp.]|nr:c-type cytochrome [Lysobacter sp.]